MQALYTKDANRTGRRGGFATSLLQTAGAIALAGVMLLQPAIQGRTAPKGGFSQVLPSTGAPLASQYFSPTGKSVKGTFLSTFNRYGLDHIGYPVSDERVENGRTVQYFQRVRMEAHPELGAQGYPVLLSRLGVDATKGTEFGRVPAFAPNSTQMYVVSTGHTLGGGFYQYWKANGGVELFGYPISEEFTQDGYRVQWFERARFEYHPELAKAGQAIQLSLLGSKAYSSSLSDLTKSPQQPAAPAAAPAPPAPAAPVAPVAVAVSVQKPAAPSQSVSLTESESFVLQSINAQRSAAGLGPVKLDAAVTDLARSRSNDMATRNYFSHTTPEGKQFLTMLGDRKINYSFGGEILARNNYPDDQASKVAFDSYMNSAPHKAIIMDGRYTTVGVGHTDSSDGMHYYTVIFIQQ